MRIVFWQNIISHLQLPYIECLLNYKEIHKIVLVVGQSISKKRKAMGWNDSIYSDTNRIEIHINPRQETINNILNDDSENSYHLFSGIRGFSFVFNAFKSSLSHNIKRGIITEGPLTYALGFSYGKPIWLHKMRFYLQDKKYIPYINSIFAIGKEAFKYYHSISNMWKIYPFVYCTQNFQSFNKYSSPNTRFIFIGRLSQRKSVKTIVQAARFLKYKKELDITIIGNGKELINLQHYVNKYQLDNIHFTGSIPNSEIPSIIQEHDILILPSIHDGWGAVVNEALMQGKYVICSNKCGAKELLCNTINGKIFKSKSYKELANQMEYCIGNISVIRNQESQRKKWANKCISGNAIAKYMIDCLHERQTKAPWLE